MKACTKTLGGILDNGKGMMPSDMVDIVHFRALTVEAHRHDRAGSWSDHCLNFFRVQIKGLGIDIDINWNTA